jgi:beta-phosphoglucomutase-like phosphatase (HAD superfamily)
MTAEEFLRSRRDVLCLVIFDCDGVLVDSEGIANRIIARQLTALGWEMTPHEAERHFLGMTLPDMTPMIEARIGRAVPASFGPALMTEFLQRLATDVTAIPGAVEAVEGVTALGLPWRVASNSSHDEMRVKFARIGLATHVAGRVHSHTDVARGKPAPDIYLAAAAAQGVEPAHCLVIEDSHTGIRAARAAGMDCLAYVPRHDPAPLRALGAVPFKSMYDLPALIAHALREAA